MSRILFWCQAFWPRVGGVEVVALAHVQALQEQGFRCAVVADPYPFNFAAMDTYGGIPIYRFPFQEVLAGRDLRQIGLVRERVAQLQWRFRPDLVHIYAASVSSLFLPRSPVATTPVVLTLHDTCPDDWLRADMVMGRLLRCADWVTACSPAVLHRAVAQVPEIADRASAITNALPLPDLLPAALPHNPARLLCLGRLVQDKGFDLALRAFALVHPRFPGVRLVIAGQGPERAALEGLAANLGIGAAVDFPGLISPSAVPALLNTASAVLVPSNWFEPFGLVALQAAQMGRPVVASRVGGLQDLVLDGQTGLLVEQGSVEALAAAIAILLADPHLASGLGHTAYHHARRVYSWERYVGDYLALYTKLLQATVGTGQGRS
jgi:glycogen(starch) synthase